MNYNPITRKLSLPLIFIAACFLPSCLRAQEPAVRSFRIAYYDDFTHTPPGLIKPVEEMLAKSSATVHVDKVEHEFSYVKNAGYLLHMPGHMTLAALSSAEPDASFFASAQAVITANSVFIQYPVVDDSLTDVIYKKAFASAGGIAAVEVSSSSLQVGVADLADGGIAEIASGDGYDPQSKWGPAVLTRYYITVNGRGTVLTVLDRIMGGLGGSQAALDYVLSKDSSTIILDNGGAAYYEPVGLDTAALSAYYAATRPDVVAFEPSDLSEISAMLFSTATAVAVSTDAVSFSPVPKTGISGPQFLCTNVAAPNGTFVPFQKYAVISRGGIRIGFLSIIPPVMASGSDTTAAIHAEQDYVSAARDAVSVLRSTYTVDFVVLVSHLQMEETYNLLGQVRGVDIAMLALPSHSASFKKSSLDFADWHAEAHLKPFYIAERNSAAPSLLRVDYMRSPLSVTPLHLEEDEGALAGLEQGENAYSQYTRRMFTGMFSSKNYLLPPARKLWPENTDKVYYSSFDIYNLAAAVIREKSSAEVSFVRIRPQFLQVLNAVQASLLRTWLEPDQNIITGWLSGADIKKLIEKTDFSSSDSHNYAYDYYLAASGVSSDGKIGGMDINSSELYKIALPEGLARDTEIISALKDIKNASPAGFTMAGAVIGKLSAMRADSESLADGLYARYMRARAKRSVSAVADAEADASAARGDYASLYRHFYDEAQNEYDFGLRELVENKPKARAIWRLNLRAASLEMSDLQVDNSQFYSSFSDSTLKYTSQTYVHGIFKFYSEYYRDRVTLTDGVSMEYGEIMLRPLNAAQTTSVSANTILFENEYLYSGYKFSKPFGPVVMGPFANLSYETQFTPSSSDVALTKIIRGKGGIKLFEGTNIKELYFALVPQLNCTYSSNVKTQYAWETGASVEVKLPHSAMTFDASGYFRDFIRTPSDTGTDVLTQLEAKLQLSAPVGASLTIGPYFDFYRLEGKFTDYAATNILMGIKLSFAHLFKPWL
jgi:hypothetical protein